MWGVEGNPADPAGGKRGCGSRAANVCVWGEIRWIRQWKKGSGIKASCILPSSLSTHCAPADPSHLHSYMLTQVRLHTVVQQFDPDVLPNGQRRVSSPSRCVWGGGRGGAVR